MVDYGTTDLMSCGRLLCLKSTKLVDFGTITLCAATYRNKLTIRYLLRSIPLPKRKQQSNETYVIVCEPRFLESSIFGFCLSRTTSEQQVPHRDVCSFYSQTAL